MERKEEENNLEEGGREEEQKEGIKSNILGLPVWTACSRSLSRSPALEYSTCQVPLKGFHWPGIPSRTANSFYGEVRGSVKQSDLVEDLINRNQNGFSSDFTFSRARSFCGSARSS